MPPSKNHRKKRPNPPSAAVGEESQDSNHLTWLISAFSSHSIDQITSAYATANSDPFAAAGILSAELVDPGESTDRLRRGKSRTAAAVAGIVPDVIGKGYVIPRGRGKGGKVQSQSRRRYSAEEAEEFLEGMLGEESQLGMGVIKDVLGECGCNVEKALDALLDISASSYANFRKVGYDGHVNGNMKYSGTCPEKFCNNLQENITSSYQLTDKSSDLSYHPSEEDREFQQYEGNACRFQRQLDYKSADAYQRKPTCQIWDKYDCSDSTSSSDSKEQPPSISEAVKLDLQQKVLESLFNIPGDSIHDPKCMDWKKAVKKVESFGRGLEFQWSSITKPLHNGKNVKGDGYTEFRSTARKHWDEMRIFYQKAAVAYSGGQRAHAAYLSEKGRYYNKLAREADQKASREIFEDRNKDIKNMVTIDLHGQHVKQAIGLLKMHLLLFTYIPSVQFLKVITGCGGADGVGKGKLKHTVIGLMQKEGIEWSEENKGTLVLRIDGTKEYSFKESSDSD